MSDNILDHISELLNHSPQHLTIIEDQIDINIQLEYFNRSKTAKQDEGLKLEYILVDNLYDPYVSIEDKKWILVQLASLEKVESFRALEKFYNFNDNAELRTWCSLALKESKMMLESSLLDEKHVLISTGMGGKNSKLRYFIVLISKKEGGFSEIQRKVIGNEFDFVLKNYHSDIEKLEFDKSYAKITTLMPLDVAIKEALHNAVNECNQYGDFIMPNFIVTNVKELSTQDIEDFLSSDENEDDSESSELDINDLIK